jgi:hypothetical protein
MQGPKQALNQILKRVVVILVVLIVLVVLVVLVVGLDDNIKLISKLK